MRFFGLQGSEAQLRLVKAPEENLLAGSGLVHRTEGNDTANIDIKSGIASEGVVH